MSNQAKERVGRYATDYVEDGMVVGLGTGSTAYYFVDELARRLQTGQLNHITAVTTSKQTARQAESLGIPLVPLDDVNAIDLVVDGADEATTSFNGIKGGGGALLHEKIVATYSHRVIWIVTQEKMVETLGRFPLPIEVVPFGSWKLFYKLEASGMRPQFRKSNRDSLFITDSGNYIIDLHLERIDNPHQLQFDLNNMVGVVETGLFLDHPHTILIGQDDETIKIHTRE